jgi:glycosyltransferase involved in cell wall biosynthesis
VITRIGLVVNAWDDGVSAPSGTGHQARLLAQGLVARGVHVEVLVLEASAVDHDDVDVDDAGAVVRRVSLRRPSYRAAHRSVGAARTLVQWLQISRCDLVHLIHPGDLGPCGAAWIAAAGTPVVGSVCDALLGCAMGHLVNPLVHRPLCSLPVAVDECAACMSVGTGVAADRFAGLQRERRALAEASVTSGPLIADSAFIARQVGNMFRADIRVIGLPVSSVAPVAESTQPGPLRIGFFGLPLWRKGVDLLLDAVDGLEGVELHIHGPRDAPTEPIHSQSVQARADLMVNVIWHPAYEAADVGTRMAGVDVVAVPSRAESLPGVAKEALAAGRPVLAANVAGLPEVIVNGVTGWLVPTEDGWRPAIARLIQDPLATRAVRPQLSRPVPAYVDEIFRVYEEAQDTWPARQADAPWRAGLAEAAEIRRASPYLQADETFQEAVWALTHGRRGAAAVGFARSATPAGFDRILQTPAWLGGLALGPEWASRHAIRIQAGAAASFDRRGALRAVVRGLLPQR